MSVARLVAALVAAVAVPLRRRRNRTHAMKGSP